MLTREEKRVPILVICDNVTIECPREQETERERRVTETESERVRAVRRERERKQGRKKCVTLTYFLFYCVLFNFLIQSSLPISFARKKKTLKRKYIKKS